MLGHGQCKKRRLESASLRGSQQQGCEGASVLVVWGNRAVGRVRCAELELLPPNLQLSLQREEGKEGQGVGKAHIEVGPTGVQGVGGWWRGRCGSWGLGVGGEWRHGGDSGSWSRDSPAAAAAAAAAVWVASCMFWASAHGRGRTTL